MELDSKALETLFGGADRQGMACPKCGGLIEVTLQDSLPHCGLRLDINSSLSGKAMDALKSVR